MPSSVRIVVVFPAPFGPINAYIVFVSTSRFNEDKALNLP